MIFVSHDLALVAEVASEITVMYAGQVIEQAPTKELLTNPIHEYTRGLLGSVLPSRRAPRTARACIRFPVRSRPHRTSPRAIASLRARAIRRSA